MAHTGRGPSGVSRIATAIAAHAIAFYTRPDDLVLDPMCGTGTTLVEAIHQGRYAIGVEYEPRWAGVARANVERAQEQGATGSAVVVTGDARGLPEVVGGDVAGRVGLVVTSPPYGPSTHGHIRSSRNTGQPGVAKRDNIYSASRSNLAYRPHQQLIDGFGQILTGCVQLLRPDGIVVITARSYRDRGHWSIFPPRSSRPGSRPGCTCANATSRCWPVYARTGWCHGRRSSNSTASPKPARPAFFCS